MSKLPSMTCKKNNTLWLRGIYPGNKKLVWYSNICEIIWLSQKRTSTHLTQFNIIYGQNLPYSRNICTHFRDTLLCMRSRTKLSSLYQPFSLGFNHAEAQKSSVRPGGKRVVADHLVDSFSKSEAESLSNSEVAQHPATQGSGGRVVGVSRPGNSSALSIDTLKFSLHFRNCSLIHRSSKHGRNLEQTCPSLTCRETEALTVLQVKKGKC